MFEAGEAIGKINVYILQHSIKYSSLKKGTRAHTGALDSKREGGKAIP